MWESHTGDERRVRDTNPVVDFVLALEASEDGDSRLVQANGVRVVSREGENRC